MRVFGIDPGLSVTGFGIVERKGNRIAPLGWGVIRSGKGTLAERLDRLFTSITEKLGEYEPDIVGVEDIFTGKNPSSGLKLGHARGILILAAARCGYEVREFPTAVVKKAITGQGRAVKSQVGFMVQRMLGIAGEKMPEDASDALAVAVCCLFRERNGISGVPVNLR